MTSIPTLDAELHNLVFLNLQADPEPFVPQIQALLERGANLSNAHLDEHGEPINPLALACADGSSQWTQALLELGARVDVMPCQKTVEELDVSPVSPFTPLGRAINHLEYELEDDGESLDDHSQGPVQVIRLLLAAGANALDSDPLGFVGPLNAWVEAVAERLDGQGLSENQVSTVMEVTDALLSSLPHDLAQAISSKVMDSDEDPFPAPSIVDHAIREALRWPPALLEGWRSRVRAQALDENLPADLGSPKPRLNRF